PIGGSYDIYLECRDQIEQGIASLVRFFEVSANAEAAKPGTVAIGADHGGFDLKEAIKQQLLSRGVSGSDFGARSTESSEHPDYAQAVATAVAQRKSEFGLLICTTGIGMSMTANKVPGVRAALVSDAETAARARQHNNANVLCLAGRTTAPDEAARIVDAFLSAHFEGGRHQRRINKMETRIIPTDFTLRAVDPDVFAVIERETQRQQDNIEL